MVLDSWKISLCATVWWSCALGQGQQTTAHRPNLASTCLSKVALITAICSISVLSRVAFALPGLLRLEVSNFFSGSGQMVILGSAGLTV